jgi:maleate cis-trans isomerase
MVATPNRTWPDFKIELNPTERKAVIAKNLAQIGMAALTPQELQEMAELSSIAAQDEPGATAQAYACIAAGHALNKYAHNRAVRKEVNSALSTVREQIRKPYTGAN